MGFRFSIEHANWLAHILQPVGATPKLTRNGGEEEALRSFLQSFDHNFFPSRPATMRLWHEINRGGRSRRSPSNLRRQIATLRDYFSDVPWIALLLPSGTDRDSDRLLTSRAFLREIISANPEQAGLVLQLDEIPREAVALEDVFPAFKTALTAFTRWPGVLLWTPEGDSIFLELTTQIDAVRERLVWLFRRLDDPLGEPHLEMVRSEFERNFGTKQGFERRCHILHISDIHLGSQLARRRMPRVQTILRSLVAELGDQDTIVPVITGDLMDTPSDNNLAEVRAFLEFLRSLGGEEPVITIGNHDVRTDGWLSPRFRQAINLHNSPAVWLDGAETVLACFNSVTGGHLARGKIGAEEMTEVGNALDRHPEKAGYTLVAALHHHPLPVCRPDWYRMTWYERILGGWFETTEALEDAPAFLKWLDIRKASAVLHGHKHIPRFDQHNGIAVIGCGSSVGKVDTVEDAQTYLSINVVTVDRARKSLSCRLRAERVPGAGLERVASHEIVLRSDLQ